MQTHRQQVNWEKLWWCDYSISLSCQNYYNGALYLSLQTINSIYTVGRNQFFDMIAAYFPCDPNGSLTFRNCPGTVA